MPMTTLASHFREQLSPVEKPHRIAIHGPCGKQEKHSGHIFPDPDIDQDVSGHALFWDCSGHDVDCTNCDDRKCMECVLRIVHDNCQDSCPFCC